MKILLDENIHLKIKSEFPVEYEVFTAREMNWNGKKNGELLSLCSENKFDIFVTLDKNLHYQQNLSKYDINIILLRVKNNRYVTIRNIIPVLITTLKNGVKNQLTVIE